MSELRAAIEQAIEWSACLRDESLLPSERRAFDTWLGADPLNAQAWNTVQGHVQRALAPVANGDALSRRTLQAPRPSRRHLLRGALAVVGVGMATQLLRRPGMPLAELGADLRTGTAERLSRVLADDSSILLDAQSAVDIHWTDDERRVLLRAGKVLVDARQDSRPFRVMTAFGSVRTAGARFMVAAHEDASHVWVLRGAVRIASHGGEEMELQSGHGARFNQRIEALAANRSGESAWQDGWLNVLDWPLGEVIEALQPYRRGVLRISPQAARLRVSGGFSLDHSDRALAALEQTMPLRISRYGDWWVSVDLA